MGTFGKCKCGKQWINHEKAFYTNPSREMTPLEVSTEEPEEKSAPAGGDNTDNKTNESSHQDADQGQSGGPSRFDNDESSDQSGGHSRSSKDSTRSRRLATAELTPSEKALRRRRLSNHPKSHVVVLERLMEEI